MKAKRIWIIIIAVIVLLASSAYITPPYRVYPRQTAEPRRHVSVRYVTPVPAESVERDDPAEKPTVKVDDSPECVYFGECDGERPTQVWTTEMAEEYWEADCTYFGMCSETPVPPTPVPATEPPGV